MSTRLRTRIVRLVAMVVAVPSLLALGLAATPAAAAPSPLIYGDGLAPGWSDWSWSSSVSFSTSPAYSGAYSLSWKLVAPWAGLYLHTDQAVASDQATSVRFALRSARDNQRLSLSLYGPSGQALGQAKRFTASSKWATYEFSLSSLGVAGSAVGGVVVQDGGKGSGTTVWLDDVSLANVPSGGSTVSTTEIRPQNATANATRGRPTIPELFNIDPSFRSYYDAINGDYVGTTEEILAWAARKWGFDTLGYPDLAKAMAVVESWWIQSAVGPTGAIGILQVHPDYWPDTDPARTSTAYNADYAMAVVRYLYDPGSWLGAGTTGSLPNAVAAWECGCAYAGAGTYASRVFNYNGTKPWLHPNQPPDWF